MTSYPINRRSLVFDAGEKSHADKCRAKLLELINKVNAKPYVHPVTGTIYPAGTVKLASITVEQIDMQGGPPACEITYELAYRSIPWNHLIRPDETVYTKATNPPIHEEGDFALLP